jgi:hypothetical protein
MILKTRSIGKRRSAFTFAEVAIAAGLAATMLVSLYSGISTGFLVVQVNRENLRAGQILLEKHELIRLYNWNQVTGVDTNTFLPTTFTSSYYPDASNGGFLYTGSVTIASADMTQSYASNMRKVTIGLTWTSGSVAHSRSMTTYVSKYGLQNYIY